MQNNKIIKVSREEYDELKETKIELEKEVKTLKSEVKKKDKEIKKLEVLEDKFEDKVNLIEAEYENKLAKKEMELEKKSLDQERKHKKEIYKLEDSLEVTVETKMSEMTALKIEHSKELSNAKLEYLNEKSTTELKNKELVHSLNIEIANLKDHVNKIVSVKALDLELEYKEKVKEAKFDATMAEKKVSILHDEAKAAKARRQVEDEREAKVFAKGQKMVDKLIDGVLDVSKTQASKAVEITSRKVMEHINKDEKAEVKSEDKETNKKPEWMKDK